MDPVNRVLVLNCGSSGLKWSLLSGAEGRMLGSGHEVWTGGGGAGERARSLYARLRPVGAVGHRLVHGGTRLRHTMRITSAVREELGEMASLDPLHMWPALAVHDAVAEEATGVPQIAAFDSSFHATLPAAAAAYALPHEWTERWDLGRLGFHGLSVDWAVRRATIMLGTRPSRLVVCHLGSGCSVTAVHDGRSIDTTMGFTPVEGLVMATRSGSVDPGLLLHLQIRHGITASDLFDALNTRSGLLGVSGLSADVRDILATADAGLARPTLAYEQFIRSIRLAIGGMASVLGGMDALVFTGGIGEHVARVRSDSAALLEFAGVRLDEAANTGAGEDTDISMPEGSVRILVIRAREDLVIHGEVLRLLEAEARHPPVSGPAPGSRRRPVHRP